MSYEELKTKLETKFITLWIQKDHYIRAQSTMFIKKFELKI